MPAEATEVSSIREWHDQLRSDVLKQLRKLILAPDGRLLSDTMRDLEVVLSRRQPPVHQSEWVTWLVHKAARIYRFRAWLSTKEAREWEVLRRRWKQHAKDIEQQAYLRATEAIRNDTIPEDEKHFKGWLWRIIRNVASDYWHRRDRQRSEAFLEDPADTRHVGNLRDETWQQATAAAMGKLEDANDREIATAIAAGETQSSIAARLGISEATMTRRWNSIKGKLLPLLLQEVGWKQFQTLRSKGWI